MVVADRCFRNNDYLDADIKGSSELFLRNTDNALLCAALVRDKHPNAIGATWGKDTTWNKFTGVYQFFKGLQIGTEYKIDEKYYRIKAQQIMGKSLESDEEKIS